MLIRDDGSLAPEPLPEKQVAQEWAHLDDEIRAAAKARGQIATITRVPPDGGSYLEPWGMLIHCEPL